MAAPWNPGLAGQPAGRRRLRRLSRQFAEVGVELPAVRLAEIAAGHPASDDELFNLAFAETATLLCRDQRRARRGQVKRRVAHSVVVLAAMVLALGTLICLGLAFFAMTVHPPGS